MPAQGRGLALLVPNFPSLRVEHQNCHLRSVNTRWRATVTVFGDHPLEVVGEERTQGAS